MRGKKSKFCDVDLGLAVSALSLQAGQRRTHRELAAFCGCTTSNIQQIEEKARRKLKKALYLRNDPYLKEILEEGVFHDRDRKDATSKNHNL